MPTEARSASSAARIARPKVGGFSRTYSTVAEIDVSRLATHKRASRYTASDTATVMLFIYWVLDGAAGFGGL
jgi:hypothetical protein